MSINSCKKSIIYFENAVRIRGQSMGNFEKTGIRPAVLEEIKKIAEKYEVKK